MSVRMKNAAGLLTAANSVIGSGQSKISVFLRLKQHVPPDIPAGNLLFNLVGKGSMFSYYVYNATTAGTTSPKYQCSITQNSGGNQKNTINTTVNIVNAVAITYDKDNPSDQAIYLNGVKQVASVSLSDILLTDSSAMKLGTTADSSPTDRDIEIEDLAWYNGYVFTLADVVALMNGDDPATIGGAATWRGHWPLTGTSGTTPVNGDVGLANAIDGSWPLTTYVGPTTAGSELVYGDPIPFVSQVTTDTPVVCSSGQSITVAAKLTTDGSSVKVSSVNTAIYPTISINGGSPVTPVAHLATTNHFGVQLYLPPGVTIVAGDSVTFTAAEGWFATGVGVAPAATNTACSNRAGKPLYSDAYPPTIRVGYNFTSPADKYWGSEQNPKNYQLRMAVDSSNSSTPALRPDGTISENWHGILLVATSVTNPTDKTGVPMELGKWVVSWDDNDPANPTTISMYLPGGNGGSITELTEYRNDGDAGGVGKTRVYDVQKTTYNYTLVSDCTSSATTLSLNTTTSLFAAVGGSTKQWIKFDDEYMDVTSFNATTKTVTVVRGLFGSTPAAHTSGTVGLMSYHNLYPTINLDISQTLGAPNYSNLVIFSPNDWTPPSPAAPAVIDRSSSNTMAPNANLARTFANSLGVLRFMDSTPTFSQSAEPEDMRRDDDHYWSYDFKTTVSWKIASIRPMDTGTCPYFYFFYEVDGGVTYDVVMTSNIITTPAAGTQEVITITEDPSNPVMAHTRLILPSGEMLRVTSVAGDQVTVVRGAQGTATALQAAATIQAGWRVPHTSQSQYDRTNSAGIEIITADYHKMMSPGWLYTSAITDLNETARINITLTADCTAGDTTLHVSAAPGDWVYIATGLHILFDSEEVDVVSANQGAGTIVVTRHKAGTAAAHTSGTVGVGRSNSVFCVSNDGTRYAWHDQAGQRQQYIVTGPKSLFSAYPVGFGGQPGKAYGTQTFDTTPVITGSVDKTIFTYTVPGAAYSYEHTARMTSLCPGARHWLNIPYAASNDLVDSIATKIRDNLNAAGNHKVVVELGNEVWNYPANPSPDANLKISLILGYGLVIDSWVVRSKAVFDRVKAVFAETGRGGDVLFSLPYQGGNLSTPLSIARARSIDVDVMSSAPYYWPGSTTDHQAIYNSTTITNGQKSDSWLFDLEYYNANAGYNLYVDGQERINHHALTGKWLDFDCYEGGVDSCCPKPATLTTNYNEQNQDLKYDPIRYFVEYDYPYVLMRRGGVTGIALFNRCQPAAGPIANSGSTYWAQWGALEYDSQEIGYGDGSDGKADNRLTLATPGYANTKHPTVNQAENVVSVRAQANLNYNYAFSNYDPVPPTNEDMPHRIPPRVVRQPKRNTQAVMARTPLVTEIPPPPTPDPVPTIGRRVTVPRLFIS